MELAFDADVPSRTTCVNAVLATLILTMALLTVGLTASSDGPFSITVHTVFLRLAIDVDVKIGAMHLHASWSALPDPAPSTPPAARTF
jgi:hypothetical protein